MAEFNLANILRQWKFLLVAAAVALLVFLLVAFNRPRDESNWVDVDYLGMSGSGATVAGRDTKADKSANDASGNFRNIPNLSENPNDAEDNWRKIPDRTEDPAEDGMKFVYTPPEDLHHDREPTMEELQEEFSVLSTSIPKCNKKKEAKSFIMIMTAHAGSTAIISKLVQHSGIFWDSNLIDKFEPLHQEKFTEDLPAGRQWVRDYFTTGIKTGQIPGFKMSILPILKEPEEWKQIIKDFDTKIIFNYRRDYLKRAIGLYSSEYLGDRTSIGGINISNDHTVADNRCAFGVGCSFEVKDMSDLHCILTRSWKTTKYKRDGVKELTNDCALEVPYEDFLYHEDATHHQILTYLGLKIEDPPSLRAKATSDNLCTVVENFAELCEAYGDCEEWNYSLWDENSECNCNNYEYKSRGGPGKNPLCNLLPPARSPHRCYGICEHCPETLENRKGNPDWPFVGKYELEPEKKKSK
ncbi:hypothetical protein NDN08_007110 [Rhodosorus marinus]|uniref:Sulfotransferase domain-containing protein n=1 Tax=Rhodosorus marinus TaxID=101924 RepID=A0AAV8UIJ5_9RHOD|nr:hypothetical protein NDN08_007110 [Rhodosorus marinus]